MNPLLCELCRNSGHVTIYNPLLVICIRNGVEVIDGTARDGRRVLFKLRRPDGRIRFQAPTAVPCKCSLGDRFVTWSKTSGKTIKTFRVQRFGVGRNYVPQLQSTAETTDEDHVQHIRDFIHVDPADNDLNRALQEIG